MFIIDAYTKNRSNTIRHNSRSPDSKWALVEEFILRGRVVLSDKIFALKSLFPHFFQQLFVVFFPINIHKN